MSLKIGSVIKVDNPMQQGYEYVLAAPMGEDFMDGFEPFYSPKEMLEHGVFEGYYLNSASDEYPDDWFQNARLSDSPDEKINLFAIKSRQPLSEWRRKGWIHSVDPRGWFEWYCRYYLGRRHDFIDTVQIKRWRNFRRHAGQIRKNCEPGDIHCRPRQRQALLQWAHDPFI